PRTTPSIITTVSRTPRSGPSTSASDTFWSPQTSRFLLTGIGLNVGGVPTNRTTPVRVPPSGTVTTSYAPAAVASTDRARTRLAAATRGRRGGRRCAATRGGGRSA